MPPLSPILLADLSPAAVHSLIAAWLFLIGGAVGSFLNVVVYRLPAGKSLVYPGSHCPRCNHPIRWYDNVPILGWIVLRGRCRDCGGRISVRYPTIEAITAAMFLAVGVIEGLSGGANLPPRPVAVADGVIFPPLGLGVLGGICAYHLLLLTTLLAAVLIEHDTGRLPVKLAVPAVLIGWLGPLGWPGLHPVPAWTGLSGPIAGLVDGSAGLALGVLLGLAAWKILARRASPGLLLGPACVGLFLGWQAVVPLTALTLAIHLLVSGLRRLRPGLGQVPPNAWLIAATLGWILAWGPIANHWPILIWPFFG